MEYKYLFDGNSIEFDKDNPDYNWLFLRVENCYVNDILRADREVFLKDILNFLGIAIREEDKYVTFTNSGDSYIDFGLYEKENIMRKHDGKNGPIQLCISLK